ncbi:MAG: D-glycerate dehydrogenase [Thermomicrobiales bacterium]|nr:D-glycerate dehydrogenase [Thermomicrobiales bacterium]
MCAHRVSVTRRIPRAGVDLLHAQPDIEVREYDHDLPPSREEWFELLNGADGVLSLLSEHYTGNVLDQFPNIKVLANFGVGYDNIDVAAATARGVAVCNTPGVLTAATAEIAWALLMAAARRVAEAVDFVKAGHWETWGPTSMLGQPVVGQTIGIVGYGRIGQCVAAMARGFDMKVLAWDRSPETKPQDGVEFVDFDTLLAESDFVSIHCPYTADTHHLINDAALAKMKSTAILVNTARGGVIDQDALISALGNGTIWAAGLDVTTPEPLAPDHPLVTMRNCVVLPHIGSATITARDAMSMLAARNLIAVLRGEIPPHIVNPSVLDRSSL